MRFRDLTFIVVSNLRRMKLRLALTALGVVIGTSAIVLMVSLGIGLQRSVASSLGDLGAATHINVMGGFDMNGNPSGDPLDDKAVARFEKLEHVQAVMPIVMTSPEITYKKSQSSVQISGVPVSSLKAFGFKLAKGRLPRSDKEVLLGSEASRRVAGVTSNAPSDPGAPPKTELVGERIVLTVLQYATEDEIKNDPSAAMAEPTESRYRMTVVGILAPADMETDSSGYISIDAALAFNGNRDRHPTYETVIVKADSAETVTGIEKTLATEGFMTFSARMIQDTLKQTFLIIQVLLGALGAIAVVVAALGIANTMTMSIYERTREIGIMKAVGASNRQIKRIFLGEAAIIGMLGGLGGLAFSAGGAALANLFLQATVASQAGGANVPTETTTVFYIPLWLAIFAIAFAAGVGLLSGVLPAVRAANLDPLVALRHE